MRIERKKKREREREHNNNNKIERKRNTQQKKLSTVDFRLLTLLGRERE